MRVLHTESSTGWGGQENRTLQEALQMRRLGVEVCFACRRGAKLGQRARDQGFAVDEFSMRNSVDPLSIIGLARTFRRQRVDIVNTHSGRDTLLAGIAARLIPRRPRIVRTRHLILPITSKVTYSVLPDHVVCVSQAVRDYLAGAGVPAHMLSTIPTGVDTARFDPATVEAPLRAELNIAAGVPLIGTVAILRMKKGHQDLIAAIPRVLAAVPEAHFVFAGDGPQRENIEQALAAAKLQERVHLLGLRSDIPQVLKSLDVFVLPTHQEALGTSYIEAQAMGVPVIGTRVGGVPATMIEGETGLLVPAQNPSALAEAIIALARDPARRQRMSDACRRWVLAEYTVERMAERMHALYQRLLTEQRG
jgi:glycosyltransferase involved in cell wall biosynthesis